MNYCIGCKMASPKGAAFCQGCGKHFGRVCQCGTSNDKAASFCVMCGSQITVEAADYVPLGWISRLIRIMVVLSVLVLVLTQIGAIADTADNVLSHLMMAVFSNRTVVRIVDTLSAWSCIIVLFSLCLPSVAGGRVRGWLANTLSRLGGGLCKLAWAGSVWAFRKVAAYLSA